MKASKKGLSVKFYLVLFIVMSMVVIMNSYITGCKKSTSDSPGFEMYEKAVSAFEAGKYEDALTMVNKAIEMDEDLAVAWGLKGEIYVQTGQKDKALDAFDKALEIEPRDFVVMTARGALLDDMGSGEEALKVLDRALVLKPEYALAWFYKARALKRLGRDEEAVDAYREAIDKNIDMVEAYTNLGYLLIDMERYDEAYEVYDRMVLRFPEVKALGLYCKACCSAKKGDKKLMLKQLSESIELEPSYRDYIMTDNIFCDYWEDRELIELATSD